MCIQQIFIYLKIGTNARQWTSEFHKMQKKSWLAEKLLPSQEELCSMKEVWMSVKNNWRVQIRTNCLTLPIYAFTCRLVHTQFLWGMTQGCQLCKRVGFPCYPSSPFNPEISTICPFMSTQTSLATVITLNQLLVLACHAHNRDLQIAPCRNWWDGISYCSVASNGRQPFRQ
jgi:hypothetical protein